MFLELIYSGWWLLLGNSFNNCQLLFSSLHSNSIGRGLPTITVCHTTRTNEQLILFAVAASVLPSTCARWLPCPPVGTLSFIRISPVVREAPTTATWRAARSLRQGDQKKTSLRTQLSSTHKLFFLPFFPDLLSKARVVGVMQIHSSRLFHKSLARYESNANSGLSARFKLYFNLTSHCALLTFFHQLVQSSRWWNLVLLVLYKNSLQCIFKMRASLKYWCQCLIF